MGREGRDPIPGQQKLWARVATRLANSGQQLHADGATSPTLCPLSPGATPPDLWPGAWHDFAGAPTARALLRQCWVRCVSVALVRS